MLKENIDKDVWDFFDRSKDLSFEGKRQLLALLLQKYAMLSTSECMLNRKDLIDIESMAKKKMSVDNGKVFLRDSKNKLTFQELRIKALTEAVIAILNSKECFKRIPRFDTVEDKF